MNRFILANQKLCVGCDACVDACAEAHKTAGLQPQARLTIVRNGDISTPITCRHCENAPCAAICPVDAITMGKSAVELDEAKCIGCKLCAVVCPFGVIAFSTTSTQGGANDQDQGADEVARTVAVKCDLCDFTEQGPECIKACATKALFLVDAKALRKSSNAKRKTAVSCMPPFMDNSTE
jgi:hydrogenase-4 component A